MPFQTKKPLTLEERRELLVLIGEAQSRNIPIPPIPKEALGVDRVTWPVDENGYILSNDGVQYKPNDFQKAFLESKARFSAFVGGRGSGKTAAGAQKALRKIMQGKSGAVIHPRFEDFKTSTWPELKRWIPWEMVVHSQRNRKLEQWQPTQPFVMVFINGARMYCKGLKDPDSARGPNINWLWYDEGAVDKTGQAWQIANASVRIGNDTEAWTTTTPKGKSHWLYKFFHTKENITQDVIDAFAASGGTRPLVEEFFGTIEQNKANLDPAFYASMLATYKTGFLQAQELRGEYADEAGQMGDRNWFNGKEIKEVPEDFNITRWVRYWDMAATEKKVDNDPDEAVGSLLGTNQEKSKYVLADQVAGWFEWARLKKVIKETALRDGPYVEIVIEQEPASGGKNQVAALVDDFKNDPELLGYKISGQRPIDRVIEANFWFALASEGVMYIVKGLWTEKFYEQLDGFLSITHDDRVTSVSGAFRKLSPFKKWKKQKFITIADVKATKEQVE